MFIPGSPSSCSGVQYHLSLQMRSAVAQSFSLSASELRWGVGELHGVILIYRKTAKMKEEQGMGLAKVCAWQPCHDTWEKTSIGSSTHKAALCTAIPGEDRAPQHIAFCLHMRLPTPSCQAHLCLRLLTKMAHIFRITWIQISRA